MDARRLRRAYLETFKFLQPFDLLTIDLVCREWHDYSSDDEVWCSHLQVPTSTQRLKLTCKLQLPRPHYLAYIAGTTLTVSDLATLTAREIHLHAPFQSSFFAAWVATPRKVVYCGGVRNRNHLAESYLIDVSTGAVEQMPDMGTRRSCAGLVYAAGNVYVFGGDNEQDRTGLYGCLKSSEKCVLQSREWSSLPDMCSPRRSFTPALWRDKVYIAGGGGANSQVEVLALESERFLECSLQIPLKNELTCAFATCDSLLVLGHSFIWEFNLQTAGTRQYRSVRFEYWYSPGGAVEYRGSHYFGVYYEKQVFAVGGNLTIEPVEFL